MDPTDCREPSIYPSHALRSAAICQQYSAHVWSRILKASTRTSCRAEGRGGMLCRQLLRPTFFSNAIKRGAARSDVREPQAPIAFPPRNFSTDCALPEWLCPVNPTDERIAGGAASISRVSALTKRGSGKIDGACKVTRRDGSKPLPPPAPFGTECQNCRW